MATCVLELASHCSGPVTSVVIYIDLHENVTIENSLMQLNETFEIEVAPYHSYKLLVSDPYMRSVGITPSCLCMILSERHAPDWAIRHLPSSPNLDFIGQTSHRAFLSSLLCMESTLCFYLV